MRSWLVLTISRKTAAYLGLLKSIRTAEKASLEKQSILFRVNLTLYGTVGEVNERPTWTAT
jgi:hypothetical protein